MLYTENAKESTKHVLEPLNEFSEVPGYKITYKKHLYFHTLAMNNPKKGSKKQFRLQVQYKNTVLK